MARVSGKAWLVGLLTLGLIAGLLGVAPPEAATGAHGDDPDIDFAATYSACAGAATESAGFEDTEGINAEGAIDCLFHYGITTGRSETMYAPSETVLRWQMALFIARAAAAAGIVLANPAQDQGFTDIGSVSEEARNAINGLAAAGIMAGTSATAFSPNRSVNRGSMAMILDAFLAAATPGVGAFGGEADTYADVKADNFAVFNDVGNVSLTTYNAIFRIYELGVTQGVGDHQFNPSGLVTRGQMAAFITRAFAHTAARPAGVSIQAEKDQVLGDTNVQLIVSVRDAAFQPLADVSVDVFSSTDPDNAFNEDGECDGTAVLRAGGVGQTACVVDAGDETTDSTGDITALRLTVNESDVTVWAWTGDRTDRFNSDDTTASMLTVGFSKAASQLLVTDNLEEGQTRLPFGETATLTVQVADEDGEPVAEEDVTVTVAQVTTPDVSKPTETNSSTGTYTTDGAGKFELSFTQNDPSSGDDPDATVALTLSNPSSYALKDEDGEAFSTQTFTWSDDQGTPAQLVLEARQEYSVATEEGRGAPGAVVATLTDQFGNPLRGHTIHFWSDDPAGVGEKGEDAKLAQLRTATTHTNFTVVRRVHYTALLDLVGDAQYTRTTNRSGQAVLAYSRDEDDSVIETIRARLVRGVDDAKRVLCDLTTLPRTTCRFGNPVAEDEADLFSEENVSFFWAEELGQGDSASGRILVKEEAARRVVFAADNGEVSIADYDGNDQFLIGGTPKTPSEFEKFMKDTAAHVNVLYYAAEAGGVSKFDASAEWPTIDLEQIPNPEVVFPDGRSAATLSNGNIHYAADGGTVVVGSYWENNYAGAVYVYDGVGDSSPQKLTAPTPQPSAFTAEDYDGAPWYFRPREFNHNKAGGQFGYAVDIRGDTLVVGEPGRVIDANGDDDPDYKISLPAGNTAKDYRDGGATDGAVYVYTKNDSGTWELDATLTVTGSTLLGGRRSLTGGAARGLRFGMSAVVSGDETTIAAGAPGFIPEHRVIGAAFVFERPMTAAAGNWDNDDGANSARLEPTTDWVNDNGNRWSEYFAFDRELAISHDGKTVVASGDFLKRRVDGVVYDWAGSAFVFNPDPNWANRVYAPDATLLSPNPYFMEKMGRSLGVSDDGTTVVVSANFRPNMMRRGKALIYERPDQSGRASNDKWEDEMPPTAYLVGPDHPDDPGNCTPAAGPVLGCNIGETFGQWVDINGDGDQILVSRANRVEGDFRGSIFLFSEPDGGWATVTEANQPAGVEMLGSEPEASIGWRNHFDQTTGDLYAFEVPFRIFKITP